MSKYKESFDFNTTDIDLIEQALRHEISVLAGFVQHDAEPVSPDHLQYKSRIRKLQLVLGKIHNQKIWYGQTHHTGIPIAG